MRVGKEYKGRGIWMHQEGIGHGSLLPLCLGVHGVYERR